MVLKRLLAKKPLPIIVAVLLASVLAFLVVKTSSTGFDFNSVSLLIREIKAVEAQWNVDMLSVEAGLANNFDPVASTLRRLNQLKTSLDERVKSYEADHPDAQASLGRLVDNYSVQIEAKRGLMEQAKSAHAILVNSTRYLPNATDELLSAVRDQDVDMLQQVAPVLNRMLSLSMSEVLLLDAQARQQLAADADTLSKSVRALPASVVQSAQQLQSHVDQNVRQRDESRRLFGLISAVPTAAALDALQDKIIAEMARHAEVQRTYGVAMIVYASALLALLGFVGRALYKNYRALNDSNDRLKAAHQEAQVMLIQSAKMSAVGQMVAGITHEINSPLAYVKATFSVLRDLLLQAQSSAHAGFGGSLSLPANDRSGLDSLRDPGAHENANTETLMEDVNSLLDDGLHGIEQISELIMTLKNFSRLDRAKRSDFVVHEGLNSALTIARCMLKHSVEVKKEYGDVVPVHCSPSQINQVFLNIITNAAQAMGHRHGHAQGLITLRTMMDGPKHVCVEIEDNGSGIPPEVLPRIFDPFFTTKKAGEGMGAGLAICRKIVTNHGGDIKVRTQTGVGTVFSILLPVDGSPEHPATSPIADSTAPAQADPKAIAA